MRILFAGTPDFAVPALREIASHHEVIAVYTQPDRRSGRGKSLTAPPVKVVAEQLHIPVYQPESLKHCVGDIGGFDVDVMVVVAYGQILSQAILDLPRYGCLNIHASLLPRWRGAAPIQRAIQAGDQKTGVSIMQMDAGLDTGAVHNRVSVNIEESDTSQSLHDKLAILGGEAILRTLEDLAQGRSTPQPQDHDQATYASKLSKSEAEIDWSEPAETISRRVRAFNPWPVAQTKCKGARLRIWEAETVPKQHEPSRPGEVLWLDGKGILVRCGVDSLIIKVLQRDGGKKLSAAEFLNGFELKIGNSFG